MSKNNWGRELRERRLRKKIIYFQSCENGAAIKVGEELCPAELRMVNLLQTFFTKKRSQSLNNEDFSVTT